MLSAHELIELADFAHSVVFKARVCLCFLYSRVTVEFLISTTRMSPTRSFTCTILPLMMAVGFLAEKKIPCSFRSPSVNLPEADFAAVRYLAR